MEYAIEVTDLKKSYKKRKTKEMIDAVKGISFQVHKGEVVGLLGPNGAGKTTLIKMMCGLLIPDNGSCFVNGNDMSKQRLKALEHISVVLEGNRNLYWRLTVRENLEYFAGNRGFSKSEVSNKINELLDKLNLKEKENEMVNTLSRGMQQKTSIAVALLADTDVIYLDEPTLGLDIETSYEIRKLLKSIAFQDEKTIIISTHDMPVVQEVCDRVIIVNHGQVVADDRVDNLLQLFESKAYSFTLNGQLTSDSVEYLAKEYVVNTRNENDGKTILDVNILHGEDLYEIIDVLKANQVLIEKIDRTTVDFEEVFMKIVKGEETYEMVKSL